MTDRQIPKRYFSLFFGTLSALLLLSVAVPWCCIRHLPLNGFFDAYSVYLDYKTSAMAQKNDIVFIGDSSCLTGVIPKVIEKYLNVTVVNIAGYGNSGIIGYDVILRRYLEKNPPPKLIVYYVSPAIPNSYWTRTFEQIFTYVRYGDWNSLLKNRGEYNFFSIQSALMTYLRSHSTLSASQKTQYFQLRQEIERTKGYSRSLAAVGLDDQTKLVSRYKYGDYFNTKNDPRLKIQKLLKNFSNENTKVILYLAPMPTGEQSFEYFREIYQDLASNQAYQLDNKYFSDYTHPTHEGAVYNSKIVASFLKNKI